MLGWCSVAIMRTSFSKSTLSSAWASANKILNATGVCLHSAAITIPNEPRPNSTPSLSVSLEIFQSFISRSFIFDGDPPPPLGRFTVAVVFGRPAAPRDGDRLAAGARGASWGRAPPGAGTFWAPRVARGGDAGVDVFDAGRGMQGFWQAAARTSARYRSLPVRACALRPALLLRARWSASLRTELRLRLPPRHAQCWYALSNLAIRRKDKPTRPHR